MPSITEPYVRNLDIKKFRTLVLVSQLGSIFAAARAVKLSQPAI
jgi:molybdenum-dependent DNA-binding transcriptional regulator ModE